MVSLTPEFLFVLYILLQAIKQAYQRWHLNTEMCKVTPAVDQFRFKLQNLKTTRSLVFTLNTNSVGRGSSGTILAAALRSP
jgi:hypothetical protein